MKTINRVSPFLRDFIILLGAVLWSSTPAFADATGQGTIVSSGCMEDVAGFGLNCTASDVRVSGVADVNGDGVVDEGDITFAPVCDATASNAGTDCSSDPDVCLDGNGNAAPGLCGDKCAFPGDTTTFSTTFIFELNAQERYDVGAYFEVKPDTAGDGALTGSCQIITLPEDGSPFTRPNGTTGNFVDLDTTCTGSGCPEPNDLCGDINSANNPIFYDMKGAKTKPDVITASCIDTDGDGKLNLPNCTSWRQSGANEVCLDGSDAFPGSPSKCNCDPDFQVPIEVPPATISVVKTANPEKVDEPGNTVQFSVGVTNNSVFADVAMKSLQDDIYGDITATGGGITSTTCSVPQTIAPGATYTCSFMADVSGQGNTLHTDIVTATGEDENGNVMEGSDKATVAINNVPFNLTVNKSVSPSSLPEPGGDFTFTVVVTNTSAVDALTLSILDDEMYGDLTSTAGKIISTDCSVPQTLAVNGSYSCTFMVTEMQNPGFSQTGSVYATASDDEGPSKTVSDDATINITNLDSKITLVKTADPTSFNEPSADVTYTFVITNGSTVDSVTIDSLTDTILGDLNGLGDCSVPQTLAANASYTCSVTVEDTGNGGDSIVNVATASGVDDDGAAVSSSDSATVTINDVLPTATLTKTPTMMEVSYEVKVTNTSTAEGLTLDALTDDRFGDITDDSEPKVIETTCAVPQTIEIGGFYTCTFVGQVVTSPHVNKVTGTVSDNDGNSVAPSDTATVSFAAD
ncbi:hypothetical protein VV869_15645 [Photobacterium sp. MCCC 1A19761]|uniref:DUF7507 domain-containing protein n=1 Tax=Photobacterium sp. MCCC 1A19761 TaxID=3115000 RepID=UPI00307E1B92